MTNWRARREFTNALNTKLGGRANCGQSRAFAEAPFLPSALNEFCCCPNGQATGNAIGRQKQCECRRSRFCRIAKKWGCILWWPRQNASHPLFLPIISARFSCVLCVIMRFPFRPNGPVSGSLAMLLDNIFGSQSDFGRLERTFSPMLVLRRKIRPPEGTEETGAFIFGIPTKTAKCTHFGHGFSSSRFGGHKVWH